MVSILAALCLNMASAQDFDGHGFQMVTGDGDLTDSLSAWSAEGFDKGQVSLQAVGMYSKDPLIYNERIDGEVVQTGLVTDLWTVNAGAFWAPHERVSISASAPLFVSSTGQYGTEFGGLGDLNVSVPVNFMDSEGLSLSAVPFASIPMGTTMNPDLTSGFVTPGVLLAGTVSGERWQVSANLGAEVFGPGEDYVNLQGTWRGVASASAVAEVSDKVALGSELLFRPTFHQNYVPGTDSPLELQAFARAQAAEGLSLMAGASTALNDGSGAATYRLFVGATLSIPGKAQQVEEPEVVPEEVPTPVEEETPDTPLVTGETLAIVYFDFDKDNIREDQESKIEDIKAYLDFYSDHDIHLRLEGNTDVRGTEGYNSDLGQRRAQAVSDALSDLGVDMERLTLTSGGEGNLREFDCDTEECHQLNRRTEVMVLIK